jgi:hypothetical protein
MLGHTGLPNPFANRQRTQLPKPAYGDQQSGENSPIAEAAIAY